MEAQSRSLNGGLGRSGPCSPRHPAKTGDPREARQSEYRPSQPGAARATESGCAR